MTRRLFGTDGIRGTANTEPVTADTALRVAMAAGATVSGTGEHRPRVVIGKDTRLSGYMLEQAMTAGFIAAGMDVVLLGPIPTPAVAMLTHSLRADMGAVISASHNPYDDNGIKFFGPEGYKLADAGEDGIEAQLAEGTEQLRVPPDRLGRARRLDDATGRYIEFVKSTLPRRLRLDGLTVVVDSAHGAAYRAAPRVLYELGAEVIELGNAPDGFNINDDAGAMAPGRMQAAVREHGADLGLALDGDADRLVLADEHGQLVDGDQILALIAGAMRDQDRLRGSEVVATTMANLGLERYLAELGLTLHRTPVGDRYVVERMRASGANLGGEPSGHIILADHTTTGDALIAALQVLGVLVETGHPASTALNVFDPVPQVRADVRVADRRVLETPRVREAIARTERALDGNGRLVIRPSGTEPLVRIMAEGDQPTALERVVNELAETVRTADPDEREAAS